MFINIEPKKILFEGNKIKINVTNIELNMSAIVRVELYSDDYKILDTNVFTLNGDEYNNWSNDDYLINYVCVKYGYNLPSLYTKFYSN